MKKITKFLLITTYLIALQMPSIAQDGWTTISSPVTNQLNSVFFINSTTGFISGNSGTLLQTTDGGQTWIEIESNTVEALNDICFVNEECGYICGSSGKLLKTVSGGTSWELISTGTYSIYYSVYFSSLAEGFAVGEYGMIAYTSDGGDSWTFQDNPATFGLYGINYGSPSHMVVGDGGMILHSENSGSTWTQISVGISKRLRSVIPRGSQILIAGNEGITLKSSDGGQNWTAQYLTPSNLNDMSFPNGGNIGWVAGNSGNIWYSNDFGENWIKQTSGTTRDLNGVFFLNASNGWAVGDYGTILHYTGSAAPRTVYVDDDNNSGIEDGSLDHPYNTVAEGLNDAAAGDTVYVFCGNYPETPLTSLNLKAGVTVKGENSSCTIINIPFINTAPYTEHLTAIKNVDIPSATVNILGGGPVFSEFYIGGSRVRHNLLYVTATKGETLNEGNKLTVENCTIEGDIFIEGDDVTYVQINDNTFINAGIRDNSGAPAGLEAHFIENNIFEMVVPSGSCDTIIKATSGSITIRNNTFDITGKATGMHLESGSPTNITGNRITFSDPAPLPKTAGINNKAGSGEVSGNIITGGYYGYISNSQAGIFENNSITKSHTGFLSSGMERVRNNTISDCRGNGIIANGLAGPIEMNTIAENDSAGIVVFAPINLGGGLDDGEGKNILQYNGTHGLVIRYQPASQETLFAKYNLWDHETQSEILGNDILNEGDPNLTLNIEGFITLPTAPVLLAPGNNSQEVGANPVLSWEQTGMTDVYSLQIAEDAGFTSITIDTGNLTQVEFNATLQPETHYYWRVKADNLAGESDWSEVWGFSTTVAGIGEDNIWGSRIFIWPNPVSDIVHCRFDMAHIPHCRVDVYDMGGKSTGLFYESKPDSDAIQLDISSLPSGIYFIRVQIDHQIMVKKVIKK
ncbi:MAG: T9SS type A sorting domain-containing protein [Bacteroidetes bacterium]|nr:T9SS type A sorting domain-containing protein [Bacteroidota bacterium]